MYSVYDNDHTWKPNQTNKSLWNRCVKKWRYFVYISKVNWDWKQLKLFVFTASIFSLPPSKDASYRFDVPNSKEKTKTAILCGMSYYFDRK